MVVQENIYTAKTHLSKLIERALRGDEVIVAKAGRPLVVLVPYAQRVSDARDPGTGRGAFTVSADFDAPLPESELAG